MRSCADIPSRAYTYIPSTQNSLALSITDGSFNLADFLLEINQHFTIVMRTWAQKCPEFCFIETLANTTSHSVGSRYEQWCHTSDGMTGVFRAPQGKGSRVSVRHLQVPFIHKGHCWEPVQQLCCGFPGDGVRLGPRDLLPDQAH